MQTILITGASDGIGKSLAILAAEKGHHLILLMKNNSKSEAAYQLILQKAGKNRIDFIACDLSLQKDIRCACERIKERYSAIDVLINNAAIYLEERILTFEGVEKTLAVNVIAPYLLMKALTPLLQGPDSSILNLSANPFWGPPKKLQNWRGFHQYSGRAMYRLSKEMLNILTLQYARQLKGKLRIHLVYPGTTATGLIKKSALQRMPFPHRVQFLLRRPFSKSSQQTAALIYQLLQSKSYQSMNGQFFRKNKPLPLSRFADDHQWTKIIEESCLSMIR